MAAITSSAVSLLRSWETIDRAGCVKEKTSDLAITLSAQGGTALDIPAATIGFNKIYSVNAFCLYDGNVTSYGALAGMSYDGSDIFPVDLTQVTDANRINRANITGVWYVRVTGIPKS